jgi:hypothetical protein
MPPKAAAPAKDIQKGKRKPKAEKEDKPKKAPGPYMVFCKEQRPKIMEETPGLSFGEIGKALGSAWGKLSEEEKASYKRDA